MADLPHQSSIQFGAYDLTYIKHPRKGLKWISLSGTNMFWEVKVEAFRYG